MTFKKLSEYFEELEKTSSRLKITEILANLFKEAEEDEIGKICYLSLGRLLPQYEGLEFQMAEKMLVRAVAKAFGIEDQAVQKQYKKEGDLGVVAEELKARGYKGAQVQSLFGEPKKQILSVGEVYKRLMEIAKEKGEGSVDRKITKMAALLTEIEALAVRFVVRIPLGKLRLGFSEMTLLDGLSWMGKGDKSLRPELEGAFNVVADIGKIAETFKKSGEKGIKEIKVTLGVPILSALAQRLPTVEEMVEKMGEVVVEPKYDGTRLQVHFGRSIGGVRVFTRNLENVTHMFPEIVEAVKKEVKAEEIIFDSEGVGVDPKTGGYLPFQETIKRKRKYGIEDKAKEIPLKCYLFDVLYKDGKSLISEPLRKRREILEKAIEHKANTLVLSPQIITSDPEEIRAFHQEQIERGLEGAMIKKADSAYEPGRRGFTWVKFKQEETKKGGGLADTLDCVIMGTYRGKGKRAGFGVGAFLVGVKKDDVFVTVSKIGTGLSDEQWREVYKRTENKALKTEEKPEEYSVDKNLYPDTWVKPEIVVEIQADNITESPIHTAGLALRFPRLVRFRDDKTQNQATTLRETEKLFELQK
ncbi:ATP-dependent DNA ligase [Candidatus Microgenomates bacterium]|jgi:DNA ligase-1|nr:MAG: ATP-dependent DNA ligase [Candidatus Microgenomates bacterium]